MNKIYIILPILVSLLTFSSHSNGEWTYFTENDSGDEFYIDYDRIKKHNNMVYVWVLVDQLKPDKYGELSSIKYLEYDCGIPKKYKNLMIKFCNLGMGEGQCDVYNDEIELRYPNPGTVVESISDTVCSQ